jgi:hypothetical protein
MGGEARRLGMVWVRREEKRREVEILGRCDWLAERPNFMRFQNNNTNARATILLLWRGGNFAYHSRQAHRTSGECLRFLEGLSLRRRCAAIRPGDRRWGARPRAANPRAAEPLTKTPPCAACRHHRGRHPTPPRRPLNARLCPARLRVDAAVLLVESLHSAGAGSAQLFACPSSLKHCRAAVSPCRRVRDRERRRAPCQSRSNTVRSVMGIQRHGHERADPEFEPRGTAAQPSVRRRALWVDAVHARLHVPCNDDG